eukprot:8113880-Alexandrium_andersonii.AAC.1
MADWSFRCRDVATSDPLGPRVRWQNWDLHEKVLRMQPSFVAETNVEAVLGSAHRIEAVEDGFRNCGLRRI